MANSTLLPSQAFSHDSEIWENLKQAIAVSSGFSCWQQEKKLETTLTREQLDLQVRRYLRETLETLAY